MHSSNQYSIVGTQYQIIMENFSVSPATTSQQSENNNAISQKDEQTKINMHGASLMF